MEYRKFKILAIDDYKDNLIALKAILTDFFQNIVVLTATSGKEGVKIALLEKPDVILLDIVMPEMDGFEVCKIIKSNEEIKNTPVLFLTALKTNSEIRTKAINVGAEAFLTKPFDETELITQISVMVKLKEANDRQKYEKERLESLVKERTIELEKEIIACSNVEFELMKTNETLSESEELYRLITENVNDMISKHSLDGRYTFLSPSCKTLLGYEPSELIGVNPYDLFHPESLEAVRKSHDVILQSPDIDISTYRIRRKDGSYIWLETSNKTIRDIDTYKPIEILCVSRDVSIKIEQKEKMAKMVEFADELLQMQIFDGRNYYKKILENIVYLSRAKFACFNIYNNDNSGRFTSVAITGIKIEKAAQALGFQLVGKVWDKDIIREEKIKDKIITRFSNLSEITGNSISAKIIKIIEDLFKIGEVFIVKILKDEQIIGDFTLLLPKGISLENESLIELYSKQIGMFITRKNAEETLKESEEKHRLLITQMQQGLAVHEIIQDETGKVVDYVFLDINESYSKLLGITREAIGKRIKEIMPDVEQYWIDVFGKVALTGESCYYENFLKSTGRYYGTNSYSPKKNQFAVIVSDITERKLAEDALKVSEEKYRLLTEHATDVIWVYNLSQDKYEYVSPSVFQLRGFTPEEAMGKKLKDTLAPESYNMLKETIATETKNFIENPNGNHIYIHEVQLPCKNGDNIWVEVSTKLRFSSIGEIELVGVSRDIEERKKAEKEILNLSYNDQLTGLYNRRFYEQELERLDDGKNIPLTLIMVDVNGLKLTNDAFGHKAGDLVLEKIAKILKKECRTEDIVSRIGGDEFVILLPSTDAKYADNIINRINNTIAKEKMDNIVLSVSIGFAIKKLATDNINDVFKEAEDDMYRHKLSESSSMRSKTIDLIMNTLYEKNNREMLHSKRVSEICEAIATKMNFDKDDINQIRIAGLMHDIGKIGIDEKILNKPKKLNEDEWNEIERHSEIGYRILSSVNEFSEIAEYVLAHHEKWSGGGYPRGLKGEEISIQARIITVADAYDAMTSDRTYRKGLSEEEAILEINKHSGTQFDPKIAKIFIEKVLGKVDILV